LLVSAIRDFLFYFALFCTFIRRWAVQLCGSLKQQAEEVVLPMLYEI
jgi:hypothetical protein